MTPREACWMFAAGIVAFIPLVVCCLLGIG